jgi:hypothetical protein
VDVSGTTVTVKAGQTIAITAAITVEDGVTLVVPATATLTIAGGEAITVSTGGSVSLPNTVFGPGTYKAVGLVTINAKTAGDEIVTSNTGGNGLILGSDATALSLLCGTGTATYTFNKSGNNDKVTLAADKITIPINSATTPDKGSGAKVTTDTKAEIKLGEGSIVVGRATTNGCGGLILGNGAKIGAFSVSAATKLVAAKNFATDDATAAEEVTLGTSDNSGGIGTGAEVKIYGAKGGPATVTLDKGSATA